MSGQLVPRIETSTIARPTLRSRANPRSYILTRRVNARGPRGAPGPGGGTFDGDASDVPYTPATEGDWDPVPAQVAEALDELAGREVGGGAVDSVNGQTGAVVLDAGDVGADPAGTAAGLVDDLSGVSNQATARTNLGLGSAATAATGDFAAASHTHTGSQVTVDASGFNGNLTTSDNTLQEVAQKLDDLAIAGTYLPLVAAGASVENVGAIESNVNTVASTGATETLDLAVYGVHDCTMSEACEFTFSNPAPSGKATIFTLILRGAYTPTLPASIDWAGTAPTYTTPSQYVFTTVDGGTTYLGQQVGAAFA